jgi:YHYH protein/Fibronectin type III domain
MRNVRILPSLVACSLAVVALAACSDDDTTGSVVTVPGAPTIGAATAGNGTASIAFTAPSSNGGATITGYTVSCTGGGATRTANGTASPIGVSTLTNGTAYSCSIVATNSAGTGAASGVVTVTPMAVSGTVTTASVLCPASGTYAGTYSGSAITSTWTWTCSGTTRSLTANGLPNHPVGTFPNAGNPNGITAQTVTFAATLTPTTGTTNTSIGGPGGANVVTLAGVKFDPGTAGTCPSTLTAISQCNLAMGTDMWRVEALGQTTFNFGVDTNNAHVQPGGVYHYHGMPVGLLNNAGATPANPKMVLVGWAGDGYPVYARYCYTNAMDATSAVKVCTGSFVRDAAADAGRPSTALVPLGAFLSDWSYAAGSGDLDDCNGRTGVTPEFPNGIYYYMATDTYPYFSRCLKGRIN